MLKKIRRHGIATSSNDLVVAYCGRINTHPQPDEVFTNSRYRVTCTRCRTSILKGLAKRAKQYAKQVEVSKTLLHSIRTSYQNKRGV